MDVYECGVAVEEGLGWVIALSASNLLILHDRRGRERASWRCGACMCACLHVCVRGSTYSTDLHSASSLMASPPSYLQTELEVTLIR